MVAITIVLLMRVVGIILVMALLTTPAAMAKQFTYNLQRMMMLSIVFGIVVTLGGLWLSYHFNLASGATIILLAGCMFAIVSVYQWIVKKLK